MIGLCVIQCFFTWQSQDIWRADLVETSVQFNEAMFADLGLIVAAEVETTESIRDGYLGFASDEASFLELNAPQGAFESIKGGMVTHIGGFVFERDGETFSFIDFVLRGVPGTTDFEMYDGQGQRLFLLRYAHGHFNPNRLEMRILNMDLHFSAEFAQRLGNPAIEGAYAGTVDMIMRLTPPAGYDVSSIIPCSPDFNGVTDVQLDNLYSLSYAARQPGVRVAIAPYASLSNQGTADVVWKDAIAPLPDPGQHPYLVLHFYRSINGRFEMMGQSDVKHAFFSVNTGCVCDGAHVLFVGCQDTYGASTNWNRTYLAPRDEVTAHTGTWQSLGSHFDGIPVDNIRNHTSSEHDDWAHRLVVSEPELLEAGSEYFIEGWYVVQNDVNIFNSMGWRKVTPTLTSAWTFAFDTTIAHGPALDAWVDPSNPGAGNAHEALDTGEGQLRVAVKTTPTGETFQYEYVVLNLDFDRQIDSFSLPLSGAVILTDITFGDLDSSAGNDWVPTVTSDAIEWVAPAGNTLDWGTAFNFSFNCNTGPTSATATLGVFEAGLPNELMINLLTPAHVCTAGELLAAFPSWPSVTVLDLLAMNCI